MDYVIRKFSFSRSRWHSQIAFPTVLMFFLVTQGTSDAEEEEEVSISLATPSAARLLLYSYVQRNVNM
ncbi:hypothetical protein T02_14343 [Trichinella nativa]|uniref:Uncharacterized protein n=1 Tax=Trichinella nativa TaxID=6335 RepID=A0A0V1KTY9_9BILA|nr:hypothetical protein T02_14343 [Trichinella nativa]